MDRSRLKEYDSYPLSIRDIYVEPGFNCRMDFTPQSVKSLADSIQETTLQDPIWVQPITDAKSDPRNDPAYKHVKWRLLSGHRRLKACQIFLKWTEIPGRILSGLTEEEASIFNFIENFERKDLNMLEEALWIARIFPDSSYQFIAKKLKRYEAWVIARQRLLELPQCCLTAAAQGKLSLSDIDTLWHIDPERREQKAKQYLRVKFQEGRAPVISRRQITRKGPYPKADIYQMSTELMERFGDHPVTWAVAAGLGWVTRDITAEDLIRRIHNLIDHGTIEGMDESETN